MKHTNKVAPTGVFDWEKGLKSPKPLARSHPKKKGKPNMSDSGPLSSLECKDFTGHELIHKKRNDWRRVKDVHISDLGGGLPARKTKWWILTSTPHDDRQTYKCEVCITVLLVTQSAVSSRIRKNLLIFLSFNEIRSISLHWSTNWSIITYNGTKMEK